MSYEGELFPRGSLRPVLALGWESWRRFPQLAAELKEEGGADPEYGEIAMVSAAFDEEEERALKQRMVELGAEGLEVSWVGPDELRTLGLGLNPEVRGGHPLSMSSDYVRLSPNPPREGVWLAS